MEKKLKCYYAHCIGIYNTPQEKRDIALLEALGFDVVNPNCLECALGYKDKGMDYFERFSEECDLIAFRGLPDGAIPAGIAKEVDIFTARKKYTLELPSGFKRRVLSVEATREYLQEVGYR